MRPGQTVGIGDAAGAVLFGVSGAGMADVEGFREFAVGLTHRVGDIEIGQRIAGDVDPESAVTVATGAVDHPPGHLHGLGHIAKSYRLSGGHSRAEACQKDDKKYRP